MTPLTWDPEAPSKACSWDCEEGACPALEWLRDYDVATQSATRKLPTPPPHLPPAGGRDLCKIDWTFAEDGGEVGTFSFSTPPPFLLVVLFMFYTLEAIQNYFR